jgi:diacylglycerol kinase (ATP)
MTVAARATLDDGLLHGYSLEVRHWWQRLALAPALRRGRFEAWRAVRSFTCRELEMRTRRSRPVNADGELITTTPAQFRIHPRAVRVYAPGVGRNGWGAGQGCHSGGPGWWPVWLLRGG